LTSVGGMTAIGIPAVGVGAKVNGSKDSNSGVK
jgi:hypothetical protein